MPLARQTSACCGLHARHRGRAADVVLARLISGACKGSVAIGAAYLFGFLGRVRSASTSPEGAPVGGPRSIAWCSADLALLNGAQLAVGSMPHCGQRPSGAAGLRGGAGGWGGQCRSLPRARSVREATGNLRPGLARAGSKRPGRGAFTTELAGWGHARSTFAS